MWYMDSRGLEMVKSQALSLVAGLLGHQDQFLTLGYGPSFPEP